MVRLGRLLFSHDLSEIVSQDEIRQISAIPRIQGLKAKPRKDGDGKYLDFVEMEHAALFQRLLGTNRQSENASYWWKKPAHMVCGDAKAATLQAFCPRRALLLVYDGR